MAIHTTTESGKLCKEDDILLSVRAPVGAVNVADKTYAIGRGLCAIRPRLHDKIFLRYLLKTKTEVLNSIATGTTFTAVSAQQVGNLEVEIPPMSDQNHIAEYLNEQTARIDRLMDMRRRQIELLKEQRAAIIQQAVTRGLDPDVPLKDSGIPWLGEIPAHWDVKRNKVIFKEIDRRSSDGSEELLTVSHLTGVTPRAHKEEVNMFLAESTVGYKKVEIGDLAINTMWAWMGALGFSNYQGIVSPSYNVYRFRTSASAEYYGLLFSNPNFIKEIIRHSTGIWESRLRLYPQAFFEICSPVPPLAEQQHIVNYVEKTTGRSEQAIETITRQLTLLAEYRASLIHECVTGQRLVNNTSMDNGENNEHKSRSEAHQ